MCLGALVREYDIEIDEMVPAVQNRPRKIGKQADTVSGVRGDCFCGCAY